MGEFEAKLTLADLLATTIDAGFQLIESVKRRQNLHSVYGVEHMGVVTRGGTESAAVMQTRKHKIQNVIP
jgi:hypothetical protein